MPSQHPSNLFSIPGAWRSRNSFTWCTRFVLMLLASRWLNRLWLLLSVIAGLSFALAVYLALTTDSVSFYLFPTRIWELMAGAILAVLEYRRGQVEASDLLSGLGLFLMLVSFVIFNDSHSDPSLPTLLPVLGTMLVSATRVRVQSWPRYCR